MDESHTTAAIQGFLDELVKARGTAPSEPIVRELLARAASRLQRLASAMLHRAYPRLARPPLNLQSEEMLSALVERLMKALRSARPENVRQFFALANQHMRWELNDLARKLDDGMTAAERLDSRVAAPAQPTDSKLGSDASPGAQRILRAIEELPDDEREVFSLVRIQGMSHAEAAVVVGVATKTVQRRLHRGLLLLADQLGDLVPPEGETEQSQSA